MVFDVGVREVGSVEEVGGRDSDGEGGPEFETWVILFDVEHDGGAVPEMISRHCGCNVLCQASGVLEESEWLVGRATQVERAEVDAQSCLYVAVVWAIDASSEQRELKGDAELCIILQGVPGGHSVK